MSNILEKLGITKSKGLMRTISFLLLLLSVKYPEIFSNPDLMAVFASLGFTVGQVRSMGE